MSYTIALYFRKKTVDIALYFRKKTANIGLYFRKNQSLLACKTRRFRLIY